MATLINQKYPLDLEARKAIGYGFPLNGNAVFKPTYQTRDQIKANLINYLLTNKKEIPTNNNLKLGFLVVVLIRHKFFSL